LGRNPLIRYFLATSMTPVAHVSAFSFLTYNRAPPVQPI
jgi:hypothetical protein